MKYFKGDSTEKKIAAVGIAVMDQVSFQRDLFYNQAYDAIPLGDMIYESKRAPLTTAIIQSIFRQSFKELFDAFVEVGTFESYLTVFKKVFGDTVDIQFTVPAPGKLEIDIIAEDLEISDLVARYIEDEEYLFDEVIDDEDDNIALQTIKGFETEYEINQMLFEMVPAGIFTTISLTVGS